MIMKCMKYEDLKNYSAKILTRSLFFFIKIYFLRRFSACIHPLASISLHHKYFDGIKADGLNFCKYEIRLSAIFILIF